MGLEDTIVGDIFKNTWKVTDVVLKTLLFPFYLTGTAMFQRNNENQYLINKSFLGNPWPAQYQGTRWKIPWLFKEVGKVSGHREERDASVHFTTKDGLEGDYLVQFICRVPDRRGASIFYWDAVQNKNIIDDVVHSEISDRIGEVYEENLAAEMKEYSQEVQKKLEIPGMDNPVYRQTGNIIELISPKAPDFDERSQRIRSIKITALKEAEAEMIRQEATAKTLEGYMTSAKRVLSDAGISKDTHQNYSELLYNQFNKFFEIDNYQTMAKEPGTIVIGGNSSTPIIPINRNPKE